VLSIGLERPASARPSGFPERPPQAEPARFTIPLIILDQRACVRATALPGEDEPVFVARGESLVRETIRPARSERYCRFSTGEAQAVSATAAMLSRIVSRNEVMVRSAVLMSRRTGSPARRALPREL